PRTGGAIDLLTEQAAAWVVGWLKQRYDLVFLDAPVWEETAELTALAEVCNALYLVVHQADAQRPRLTVVSRAIARQGGRLRGLIHTRWETASPQEQTSPS